MLIKGYTVSKQSPLLNMTLYLIGLSEASETLLSGGYKFEPLRDIIIYIIRTTLAKIVAQPHIKS